MLLLSERVLDRSNGDIAVDHYHRYRVLSIIPSSVFMGKDEKVKEKKKGGGHLILIYHQQQWELTCSSVSTMLICLFIVLLPRIRNLLFEMFVMHFSGRHRAHGKFRFSRLQIFYILGSYISW